MTEKEKNAIKNKAVKDIVKIALSKIGRNGDTIGEKIFGEVLVAQALNGDLKAIDMLTKLLGEEEPTKVEITGNIGISHEEAIKLIKNTVDDGE